MIKSGLTPSAILTTVVETGLNAYLDEDREVRAGLLPMDGRVLAIDLMAFGTTLYLSIVGERVHVSDRCETEPDVMLRGTPATLAQLALDPMAENRVELIGNVGVGRQFQQLLADVKPDWEEKISRLLGDVAAHELGRVFRGARAWGAETRRTWEINLGEYLQEERRDLPAQAEVAQFLKGVDDLRSDLDRLVARLRRLEHLAGAREE